MKGTSRLRLRTKDGFMERPVLDGVVLDSVTSLSFMARPFGPPVVRIEVLADTVFNGRAFVKVDSIVPESSPEARAEFVDALNRADAACRRPGTKTKHETPVEALVEELDRLGWGFYRKKVRS